MAALDAHPLHTRHLALTLFGLTVCITTLFNGLFRGAEGAGGRGGQETFQEFPVDEDPARSHWEGPGESDRWHHVEVEGGGSWKWGSITYY